MSTPATGPAAFVAQRRTILTILCVPIGIFLIAASAILFGGTSHNLHTGSVAALEESATEYLRLAGAPVGDVQVAGTISTVNSYWGEFFAAPTTTSASRAFPGEYGFAEFESREITLPGHRGPVANFEWVIVAAGTHDVGCGSAVARGAVPTAVLSGFHAVCASAL